MHSEGRMSQIRLGVMAGALPALVLLLAAGGQSVALVVAIAAIAVLVLSYMRVGVLIARAPRDERARRQLARERRHHARVMLYAPLIVFASHPWGWDTIGVILAVGLLCQVVFTQAAANVVLMRGRRARRRIERRERWEQNRRARGTSRTRRPV